VSPQLSREEAARLVQGRMRHQLASKAERQERNAKSALSRAACALQSGWRRRTALLRVLNLAAYRKIDEAMAEVSLQLQEMAEAAESSAAEISLSSAATTISRHARGRGTRRRLHADAALRRMLRLDEPRHVLLTRPRCASR